MSARLLLSHRLVVVPRGKKQDYNFYSFDRELAADGRPYLEMIQRILRAH